MNENVDHRVPVLIVGGSLVGLSASLFLGRLGIEHLLVEKHAATSTHPRGRGNNVRTMEVFRTAGVEQRIREAASVLADNHGILQAGSLTGDDQEWLFKEIDPGGGLARFSPSGWCLCSQNDLEPVLLAQAREQGSDLRFSTELLSFDSNGSTVDAVLKNRETGEHTTVRADYLIAADGPRSPIREQLRIGRSGPGDLFHNVSITFRSKKLADVLGDRRFIVCYLTNPAADGALLPVDNEQDWVFHAPWKPEQGETLEDFTDERCADHIRRATGAPDIDVEITGRAPWHAAERVADRYGSGRVFLMRRLGPRDVPHRGIRLQHRYPGRAQPRLEARRSAAWRGRSGTAGHVRGGAAAGGPGDERAGLRPFRGTQPPRLCPTSRRGRREAGRPAARGAGLPLCPWRRGGRRPRAARGTARIAADG